MGARRPRCSPVSRRSGNCASPGDQALTGLVAVQPPRGFHRPGEIGLLQLPIFVRQHLTRTKAGCSTLLSRLAGLPLRRGAAAAAVELRIEAPPYPVDKGSAHYQGGKRQLGLWPSGRRADFTNQVRSVCSPRGSLSSKPGDDKGRHFQADFETGGPALLTRNCRRSRLASD
jgi:hypothetical protein